MPSPEAQALLDAVRAPSFDTTVDLEAHLALLSPDAKAKGLYHADTLKRVEAEAPGTDLFALAGIEPQTYRAFLDYSFADLLRLLHASSRVLFPELPEGEALRRLGRFAYKALAETQIGRVVFGVFGRDFGRVAAVGAKGWNISLNFSKVKFERLGDDRGAYFFEGLPGFLETYQVGVVEGAMETTGAEGNVRAHIVDLQDGVIEFDWRQRK